MTRPLVYVDTETTGLDPRIHWAYEGAWAFDTDDAIHVCHLPHTLEYADPQALAVGCYWERNFAPHDRRTELLAEMRRALLGAVLVGANPGFDAAMLTKTFGMQLWHYRMVDVESYAMAIFRFDEPPSLLRVAAACRSEGFQIPDQTHTAEGDVRTTRAVYRALRGMRVKINPEA